MVVELELQSDTKREPTGHLMQLLYECALKPNAAGSNRRDWSLFPLYGQPIERRTAAADLCSALERGSLFQGGKAKPRLFVRTDPQLRFVRGLGASLCGSALMLTYASSSEAGSSLCEIREQFKDQLNRFSLARRLWHSFLALMGHVIDQMNILSENLVNQLVHTVNRELEQFFEQSLQLDVATMRSEHDSAPLP